MGVVLLDEQNTAAEDFRSLSEEDFAAEGFFFHSLTRQVE